MKIKTKFYGPKHHWKYVTYYLKNGKMVHHSIDDQPARVTQDGGKQWMKDGVEHRDSGPSWEHPDGIYKCWHYNGEFLGCNDPCCTDKLVKSNEDFERWKKLLAFN